MNKLTIGYVLLVSSSLSFAVKELNVTCKNDNKLVVKQRFTGTNGITFKANDVQRTPIDPLLPDEIIPDGVIPIAEQTPIMKSCTPLSALTMLIQPKIIIGTIGITYGACIAYLLYIARTTVAKNDTWASWKQEIPNNVLAKAETNIAKELYADIQTHYADQKDTASFLTPLIHFVNDVDAEIRELTHFITLHETLITYKISRLFPAQEEDLALAAKKIKRLELLKQFMIKSIREYKVA